jgi:hypothetical protein
MVSRCSRHDQPLERVIMVCSFHRASRILCVSACAFTAFYALSPPPGARAQSITPLPTDDAFHETETKYMFGFLDGSDIGNENEQAIELETTGSFGKRTGRYSTLEQEIEYEAVPTQNFAYELSAHGMFDSISNVEGLDDINQLAFSGLSGKFSYLIIGRGPGSPIGLNVSVEPEWGRIDDAGLRTQAYSAEFRLAADTALIPNRLYGAFNVSYAPGVDKGQYDTSFQRGSDLGLGVGLAYRVTPTLTFGGTAEYDASYDGLVFNSFGGNALFVGPTMQINFTPKILLAATVEGQVWGHAANDWRALDLVDFSKYKGNLKLEFEF